MVNWDKIRISNPKILEKYLRFKDIEFDEAGPNEHDTNDSDEDSLQGESI